jgi:hypothetical protein
MRQSALASAFAPALAGFVRTSAATAIASSY